MAYQTPDGRVEPEFFFGERDMLVGWLNYHRETAIHKLQGLSNEDARRRPIEGSLLNPLGVVYHLAFVEWGWFRTRFAGEPESTIWDESGDPDIEFKTNESVDVVIGFYREQIALSDQVIAGAALDDMAVDNPEQEGAPNMRWCITHLIEETARHNGHLDLLRELLDGTTGT